MKDIHVIIQLAKQVTEAHQQYLHLYSRLMELVENGEGFCFPEIVSTNAVAAPSIAGDSDSDSDDDEGKNPWVKHVRAYAREHGMTYVEATKDAQCRSAYHNKETSIEPAVVKVQDYEATIPEWALQDDSVKDVIDTDRFNPIDLACALFNNSNHPENWSVCSPSVRHQVVRVRKNEMWIDETYDSWLQNYLRYIAIPLYFNRKGTTELTIDKDAQGQPINTDEKAYMMCELKQGGELEDDFNYFKTNIKLALESMYRHAPRRYA